MSKADKALLRAVLEPRKPGALSQIAEGICAWDHSKPTGLSQHRIDLPR